MSAPVPLGAKRRAFRCGPAARTWHSLPGGHGRPRRKSVTRWVEGNYEVLVSATPGKWRAFRAPLAVPILEDIGDDDVTLIGIRAAAQATKSETTMAGCAWSQDQDPDPAMWVAASGKDATDFCVERLMPALDKIEVLSRRMPRQRHKRKTRAIHWKSHSFDVASAASITQLQSKPRRWLFLDEVRNWKEDRLPTVVKRVGTFWNEKIVVVSTPGLENDSVDLFFQMGDQRHWHVPCHNPACLGTDGRRFHAPMDFHLGMKWDTNEKTFPKGPEGPANFEELAKTIRYECPNCHHTMKDEVASRDHIAMKGYFYAHNPTAPKGYHTYTWSKMILRTYPWRKIVQEFLEAQRAKMWGNIKKLQQFITETLGLSFTDRMRYNEEEDPLEARKAQYHSREVWADAKYRILTVDVQKDCLYYVCREWSEKGHSRLHAWGTTPNFQTLRGIITELKIGRKGFINNRDKEIEPDKWFLNQNYVCVDSGKWTARIYKECVNSGYQWNPFKGAGEKQRKTWKDEDGVEQIFTQNEVDAWLGKAKPGMPTRPLLLTSLNDFAAQEMLDVYIHGEGLSWELPYDVDPEYSKGVMSEQRITHTDRYGYTRSEWIVIPKADNHYRDCEKMQLIAAMVCNILKMEEPADELPAKNPIPEGTNPRNSFVPEPDFEQFDRVYPLYT